MLPALVNWLVLTATQRSDAVSAAGNAVCIPGMNNPSLDLNGGPTMMEVADADQCRALCEDHELCGAFVMVSRVHDGCLKENVNTPTSHTNLPRLFPAAQCFLKAPLAGSVKLASDPTNCTCAGVPRAACPTGSKGRQCAEMCPTAHLTNSHGVRCGRRRGFSLGGPLPSPSANDCESACTRRDDCVAWSWTSCGGHNNNGTCSLKNLVGRVEDGVESDGEVSFSCTGTKKYVAPANDLARTSSAEGGAQNNLTTWGYIQNPYHRVRHHSGVLRAHDRLNGVALYTQNGGPNDPNDAAPSATIFVAAQAEETATSEPANMLLPKWLITATDFDAGGVERTSPLHTKSRLAIAHGNVETVYYQASENVMAAKVHAATPAKMALVIQLDTGAQAGAGAVYNTSCSSRGGVNGSILITGGPPPGYWGVAVGASGLSDGTKVDVSVFDSLDGLRDGLARPPGVYISGGPSCDLTAACPASRCSSNSSVLFIAMRFCSEEPLDLTAFVSRASPEPCTAGAKKGCSDPERNTLSNLNEATRSGEAQNQLNRHAVEDNRFWSGGFKLEGSWPTLWKRGVQYDLNTVRANIRPARGVFKHPWDAMQVHGPRIVVAESSMDTMTLSYADVQLAKDVLYGLYADTAARGQPQAPCQNEDGTTNMECMDGHTAGTPPSWGAPLFTVYSIFLVSLRHTSN
eukprot:COSAG02_NODE_4195_length_5642_cov_16.342053_3_plen_688_part_00